MTTDEKLDWIVKTLERVEKQQNALKTEVDHVRLRQLEEPTQTEQDYFAFQQPPTDNEKELIELAKQGKTKHAQELLRKANKTEQDLKADRDLGESLGHAERLRIKRKKGK
jgi:hypothetical protein